MGARRPWLLALLLLPLLGATPAYPQDAAAFAEDLDRIAELAPRREGSVQEREAIAYVRERLETAGLAPTPVIYTDAAIPHSYSTGLEVRIPGTQADTLLLVVPMDQVVQAGVAGGGNAGAALALRLALHLSESPRAVPVRVVFLGAEHGFGPDYPLGSRRYLSAFLPSGAAAVLYLDIAELPARLSLVAGSGGVGAPRWMVRELTRSLAAVGLEYRLRGNLVQLNRLGLASNQHPVAAYLRSGHPALALVSETASLSPVSAAERERWVLAFEAMVDRLLQDLEPGVPGEWDRHYLTFQVGQATVIVPEGLYVALLGALVTLCLLYAAFSGNRGRRYAVAFARGGWSVPLHLGLLFVFALVPTLVLETMLEGFGFPTLWRSAPLEMGLLKILLSASLFALLTPLVTRTVLPRGDTFYSSAALLLQGLALAAVSLYEVSLAVYFAWGLLFLFLSTLARDRAAKIALFALAPVWTARAVIELFWLGQMELIRWILLDRIAGSLLLAGVAAPYYFMGLRLRLLLPARRHRLRRALIAAAGALLLMAATAVAAWIAAERPYRGGAARPIAAKAVYDYDTGSSELYLDCPIAIGEAAVRWDGRSTPISTRSRQARLDIEAPPAPLVFAVTGTPFLNRQAVRLTLVPGDDDAPWPYRLALRLESRREFVIFDANLPFARLQGGQVYVISVGAGPPRGLDIEVTLPQGLELTLVVDARYLVLPPDLEVEAAGAVIEPSMDVRISYRFST